MSRFSTKKTNVMLLVICVIVALCFGLMSACSLVNEPEVGYLKKVEIEMTSGENEAESEDDEDELIEETIEESVETEETTTLPEETTIENSEDGLLSGLYNVEIVIVDYGTISVELDADVAPITVTNFIKLVNEGFYDGLTFHRIIDGFVMQGGANPYVAVDTIVGEFSSNGYVNNISHVRGVISMARALDPNSANSQFFIVQEDAIYLDGSYAGFGYVTDGMDIVDEICSTVPVTDNNGTVPAESQPVIETIRVVG